MDVEAILDMLGPDGVVLSWLGSLGVSGLLGAFARDRFDRGRERREKRRELWEQRVHDSRQVLHGARHLLDYWGRTLGARDERMRRPNPHLPRQEVRRPGQSRVRRSGPPKDRNHYEDLLRKAIDETRLPRRVRARGREALDLSEEFPKLSDDNPPELGDEESLRGALEAIRQEVSWLEDVTERRGGLPPTWLQHWCREVVVWSDSHGH